MNCDGKHIVILGMGRSGLAAARLARARGAQVLLSDAAPAEKLRAVAESCDAEGIPWEAGGHDADALTQADFLIISPGIPTERGIVAQCAEAGVPIMGELEFASRFVATPLLAVTGTNGKTTTTELMAYILRQLGYRTALAGNNATPLSTIALENEKLDYIVVEVSSYQLETVETFHPRVATILNLSDDHLARHGTMATYAATKARLMAQQQDGDVVVLNEDDPIVRELKSPQRVRQRGFSLEHPVADGFWWDGTMLCVDDQTLIPTESLKIPGRHNIANTLAALTALEFLGLDGAELTRHAASFPGVAHRIELVAQMDGVAFYNDSKATNVDSLRVALLSFERPIVLIAGGQGKGAPYDSLASLVRERVKTLVVMGEDGPKIKAAFEHLVPVREAKHMADAVALAHAAASAGDVALLSPACASFDAYANFEARGDDFRACVKKLPASNTSGAKEESCAKK